MKAYVENGGKGQQAPALLMVQMEPLGVDVEGAAALTSVAVETLNELRIKGGGPRFRKFGRKVIYLPSDLADWLEALPCFSNTTEAELARGRG
jgi:hypothetical protein